MSKFRCYTKLIDKLMLMIFIIAIVGLMTGGASAMLAPPTGSSKIMIDSESNINMLFYGEYHLQYYFKIDKMGNILQTHKNITTHLPTRGGDVTIDSNRNFHIICRNEYIKIDAEGNGIIHKDVCNKSYISAITIGKNDTVHIACQTNNQITYIKLDDFGNILEDVSLNVTEISFGLRLINPAIGIDSIGNVNICWRGYDKNSDAYRVYYIKIGAEGKLLINETILATWDVWSAHPSLSMVVDFEDNIHVLWDAGYRRFDVDNQTWLPVSEVVYGSDMAIDSKSNLHIIRDEHDYSFSVDWERGGTIPIDTGCIYYTKLDGEGNILINKRKVTEGTFASISIDNEDNVHIAFYDWRDLSVWDIKSKNPGIYYTKLDGDGNVLIKERRLGPPYEDAPIGLYGLGYLSISLLVGAIGMCLLKFKRFKTRTSEDVVRVLLGIFGGGLSFIVFGVIGPLWVSTWLWAGCFFALFLGPLSFSLAALIMGLFLKATPKELRTAMAVLSIIGFMISGAIMVYGFIVAY